MNLDIIKHKWLHVPYMLNVHIQRRIKKPQATLLFIHGIGASSNSWDKVAAKLPPDVNVVTVDLLGFGLSPRPTWAVYDARRQARSVIASCRRKGVRGPVIIVGHSMGSLVAVEIAKMNRRFVSSLVLCSPPFYAPSSDRSVAVSQKALTALYSAIQSHPEQFIKISRVAAKYNVINRGFKVDEENIHAYMNALEASIVNQTALGDVQALRQPIMLLYGTLDPVVVTKHLKRLEKSMPNVSIKSVIAAHEIKGPYITVVVRAILATIGQATPEK